MDAGRRPAFVDALARLGVESAAAALLVNPRALDAEMQAKIAEGKPAEQAFLTWFAAKWKQIDAAALFLNLDKNAEVGLAIRPRDGERLLGPVAASRLWSSIPDDALVAFAGQQKLSELVDSIHQLLPEEGRRAIKAVVDQALVPGRRQGQAAAGRRCPGPELGAVGRAAAYGGVPAVDGLRHGSAGGRRQEGRGGPCPRRGAA